jgi:predicted SAM-dependent methyltransferase
MTIKMMSQPAQMMQTCPLCSQKQPIYVRGMVKNLEDSSTTVIVPDRGYSFCNCHNIFFTNWANIQQSIYNEDYKANYISDYLKSFYDKYREIYFPIFSELNPHGSTFLDVGCINPYMLEVAEEYGWEATGLDIMDHKVDNIITGSFEDINPDEFGRYDFIWLSHVFEHFKDPEKAVWVLNEILNEEGIAFIAMPDTFAIDWEHIYNWGHWHVNEHHILWDMVSFIKFMEDRGFSCKFRKRNASGLFICNGDFHLVFQK